MGKQIPLSLKAAVTPIHKKAEKIVMKYYRPVSLIPNVSKLFKTSMYYQIPVYYRVQIILENLEKGLF